jgi:hypothetical protein
MGDEFDANRRSRYDDQQKNDGLAAVRSPRATTDVKTSAAQHGVSMPAHNPSLFIFTNPRRHIAKLHKRVRISSSHGRRFIAVRLTPAISKFLGDN